MGCTCPDFEFEDGTRVGTHLRTGHGLLLDFDASLTTLQDRWRERVDYISNHPKDRLGLTAALVRPDGFVAWASDAIPDAADVARAAAHWWT